MRMGSINVTTHQVSTSQLSFFTFAYSPHNSAKNHTKTVLRAAKGDSASSFRISLVTKLFPGLGYGELSSLFASDKTCFLELLIMT